MHARPLGLASAVLAILLFGLSPVPPARAQAQSSPSAPVAAPASPDAPDDFEPPPGLEDGWYARIETPMGRILLRLMPEQAPQSVAHFAGLAEGTLPWTDVVTGETVREPYYDGMPIHTVYGGRFFETGDSGALGRPMPMLYVPEEGFGPVSFNHSYVAGMTRMSGARISAVKFFVTIAPQPWLNGESPCFGRVVEGKEVVLNISAVKAYRNHRPIEDLFIEKIRIFAVGTPPPLPEPRPHKPTRIKMDTVDPPPSS